MTITNITQMDKKDIEISDLKLRLSQAKVAFHILNMNYDSLNDLNKEYLRTLRKLRKALRTCRTMVYDPETESYSKEITSNLVLDALELADEILGVDE